MFDLQNKVAVITGGNGGIGFGMAQGLATAGARIVIAARNAAKSAAAVELLQSSGAETAARCASFSGARIGEVSFIGPRILEEETGTCFISA